MKPVRQAEEKQFGGFPARSLFTPVHNVFFSEILPEIDDIDELKVTLSLFRLLYPKRGTVRFVTGNDLLADKSLAAGMSNGRECFEARLTAALEKAAERGTFLRVSLSRDGKSEDLFFLNTAENKEALRRIETGEVSPGGLAFTPPPAPEAGKRPDIFTLYEENIGPLTPLIADELREAEKLYPAKWIDDAIKEAVTHNKRSWRYIARILENWTAEGKSDGTHQRNSAANTKPDKSSRQDQDKYKKQRYGDIIRR